MSQPPESQPGHAQSSSHDFHCIICKSTLSRSGSEGHRLDPCGLVIIGNVEAPWRERREQTFFCHFECFRRLVGDDGLLYIQEPDFATNAEVEDEARADADSSHEHPSTFPY